MNAPDPDFESSIAADLPAAVALPSGAEQFEIFISAPQGLEPLLVAEATSLGALGAREARGGVRATADWAIACRLCLWSRLANRVLLPIARLPAGDADAMYAAALQIPWMEWFDAERSIAIETAGQSPLIANSHFAALRLKDAVVDAFRAAGASRPSVDTENPDVAIHLFLDRTGTIISLDISGGSLHRRGYRGDLAEAPLKENLAAAILVRAGWPALAAEGAPLLDPMCGSGTLPIEAAMIAADIAPGLLRARFGGAALRPHQPDIWDALIAESRSRRDAGLQRGIPAIRGADIDPAALKAARANARRAGLESRIEWVQADVSAAQPWQEAGEGAQPSGLIVCNPPYGVRLGSEAELIKLYSLFGAGLKRSFPGWRAAIFSARPDLTPRMGLRAHKLYALRNGALDCKLLLIDIPAAALEIGKAAAAEDFANRIRKNLRHLSRWAERSGIDCWRLYDADLPDYALAVDLYKSDQLHAVVQEYAAPATIDPVHAERRLRDALQVLHEVLQLPAAQLHYRIRKPMRGTAQYVAEPTRGETHEVDEHGCRLLVNFTDYLDTGLFLDHRPLRLRIQRESAGKRFLNLFCYTASASAHAIRGGASGSVSVDLSMTYLEWSRSNLAANGATAAIVGKREVVASSREASSSDRGNVWRGGTRSRAPAPRAEAHPLPHQLIQADCLQWLRTQARSAHPPRFDLILCDPPTFSNSKRMDGTLDVQRDHLELIANCMRLLSPGGTLYFSTNRRRFKLDQAALEQWAVSDITAQTLDEDFKRPPPPHRCWAIRHRTG